VDMEQTFAAAASDVFLTGRTCILWQIPKVVVLICMNGKCWVR